VNRRKNIAVFLCNLTLNAARPWLENGYAVVLVDPQHPEGVRSKGKVVTVGSTIDGSFTYLGKIIRSNRIGFVAGFPPCTDVALSGTRWWAAKRESDPYFQARAAMVAEQCRTIGAIAGCPWFFENPKSAFSRMFGEPQHKFNPYDYTAYCKRDNYKKETWLWSGGGFVMPPPNRDFSLGPPDDRIHKAPPTKDPAVRANFRSATPIGFSKAVCLFNCDLELPK